MPAAKKKAAPKVAAKKPGPKPKTAVKKPAVRRGRPPKAIATPVAPVVEEKPLELEAGCQEQAAPEELSILDQLQHVDILDMRGLTPVDRVTVLGDLTLLGFLSHEGKSLLESLDAAAAIIFFRVNNTNRLLIPTTAEETEQSYAVCHPRIINGNASFKHVAPYLPMVISHHGAQYIRMG